MQNKPTEKREDSLFVYGRNAVWELLKSGQIPDVLYLAAGLEKGGVVSRISALAKEMRIVVKTVDSKKLDLWSENQGHQGVAALLPTIAYSSLEDMLESAAAKGEAPFLVLADEIEDPHNMGALIRTADAAGAHGFILPKRRSASVNGTVYKTSAGACAHLPIARVTNLTETIDFLKKSGIWIYGADMDGSPCWKTDFSGGAALVVGSEGKGLGRLIREKCDVIVSLPMFGQVNSLNASVAGGILLYEIARGRHSR